MSRILKSFSNSKGDVEIKFIKMAGVNNDAEKWNEFIKKYKEELKQSAAISG